MEDGRWDKREENMIVLVCVSIGVRGGGGGDLGSGGTMLSPCRFLPGTDSEI